MRLRKPKAVSSERLVLNSFSSRRCLLSMATSFDTYALIDHGAKLKFLLDTKTKFPVPLCEPQTSNTLQYVNSHNKMPLSKDTKPVIIIPHKSLRQNFEISCTYRTAAVNVTPNNIFELNQICATFYHLCHIFSCATFSSGCWWQN